MNKPKNHASFSDMMHMLENMNGLELYRIMIDMPGSSGFLHDLDRFLRTLAEVKIEAGTLEDKSHTRIDEPEITERIEEKNGTIEEQRVKFFAVDQAQRMEDQAANLAAEQGISIKEAHEDLEQRAYWD